MAVTPSIWQAGRYRIDLAPARVMGIVNVTPDSFSDGGLHADTAGVLRHAEHLLRAGADILDVGGESSRPGSAPVDEAAERARVVPVLRELVRWGVPISIDTCKPGVMRAALDLGADIVNDIWALRWRGDGTEASGVSVVAAHPSCGVCLMHMHRDPQTMQIEPMAGDAVGPVRAFLERAATALGQARVGADRIVLDPGIGFGKTPEQNFALLARQDALLSLGYPLLVGWSRKSSLGAASGRPVGDRVLPSVAAALIALERGARILRVHDVEETVAALHIWRAVQRQDNPAHTPN